MDGWPVRCRKCCGENSFCLSESILNFLSHSQAWSEHDRNIVVAASGDGSLQIWDADLDSDSTTVHMPKSFYREHTKEVCSVDWSPSPHNRIFLSGSWDQSIKLWDPLYAASMRTYNGHSDFVFNAKFSPGMANVFASVGADGFLKLWDVLDQRPKASLQSHQYAEVCRSEIVVHENSNSCIK